MSKLIKGVKDNKEALIAIIMLILWFYFLIVELGITTHDELGTILTYRAGAYWQQIRSTPLLGRGTTLIMNSFPVYFSVQSDSMYEYRVFTILGIVLSVVPFSLLMGTFANRKISWGVWIMFFLLAQLQCEHNGLTSFGMSYQISTCYVFWGLVLFYKYLEGNEKKYLIISVLLYLMSSIAYEAFILYGVLFFLIDFMYLHETGKLTINNLYNDLKVHFFAILTYVTYYVMSSILANTNNGDATIGSSLYFVGIIDTIWKLSIGLLPLRRSSYSIGELLQKSVEISAENVLEYVIIILALIGLYNVIIRSAPINIRRYGFITIFCFIGMLLPNILLGFTDKFINWIHEIGQKGFGTSYFSYFFIIGWITVTIEFFYHIVGHKRIYVGLVLLALLIISKFTFINNIYSAKMGGEGQKKIDLFLQIVDTDYFRGIDDDAQIYCPDFVGVHNQIGSLAVYINSSTNKTVMVTNNKSDLDYKGAVYYLDYDNEAEEFYLSKVDKVGRTDEIYIYGDKDLSEYGIIFDRDDDRNIVSRLNIDGIEMDYYADDVVTAAIGEEKKACVVKCDDMYAETFELYKAAGAYNNSVIRTEGLYFQEEWGRWGEKNMVITFNNPNDTPEICLKMSLFTPGAGDRAINITCDSFKKQVSTTQPTSFEIKIPVKQGDNRILISSSAEDIEAPEDPRNMNMQISEMTIFGDDFETPICTQ